jgi:hypothetical protein
MKQFILLLTFFGLSLGLYAQEGGGNAATANYSIGDLEKLNKLELTSIYIAKMQRLYSILPFIPFEKLEPANANDLKIPAVKSNEKALDSLSDSKKKHNETLDATLSVIIPYANKRAIIESIIFLQSFINKVELIGVGMSQMDY